MMMQNRLAIQPAVTSAVAVLLLIACTRWGLAAQPAPQPAPKAEEPSREPEPAAPSTPPRRPAAPDLRSLLAAGTVPAWPGDRLAGMPNMFGDSLNLGGHLTATKTVFIADVDLPLAAASRRAKVGENNKPLTQDRVYFMYNHFHHALSANVSDTFATTQRADFSVNRYTVGFEKTLLDELWSVEVRMPFADQIDYNSSAAPLQGGPLAVSGGDIGNLAILLKRMVLRTDTMAACIGLGVDIPTGDDARASFGNYAYTMQNQAVHLLPYAGVAWMPGDRVFYQGFLQVDVPTNGNRFDYTGPLTGTLGKVYEQTLMYIDVAAGVWLLRRPQASLLTGLAAVVEFHHTTTLQDAHSVSGLMGQAIVGNPANRMDISNLTVGLHGELAHQTLVRVGGVFPLSSGDNRWFDAEVQVQVERRF